MFFAPHGMGMQQDCGVNRKGSLPAAVLQAFFYLHREMQMLKTEAQTAQLAARTLVSARVAAWEAQFPFPLAQVIYCAMHASFCR